VIGRRRRRALEQDEAALEEPTHEGLWRTGQLEAHAAQIAEQACAAPGAPRVDVQARLQTNVRQLERAYVAVATALRAGRAITPASEWLVDNFHLIAEHATDIPLRLTPRVWRALPAAPLERGACWPRIFFIVREYLAHTDCDFEPESFIRYLLSYQRITPLTMRELWALYPILRMALIDELRRMANRMEAALAARGAADDLANELLTRGAQGDPAAPFPKLSVPAFVYRPPFIVQLAQRLQTMGDERGPMLDQLAGHVQQLGTTIDDVIQREHARRSASNLTVRNIITSLRSLATLDWRTLFESTSQVELLLHEQPSYSSCDRRTRDRYRDCIEDLSRASQHSEIDVATQLSRQLLADGSDIGELLIGMRRHELEAAFGFVPSRLQRLRRWILLHARSVYCGGVVALTTILAAVALDLGIATAGAAVPAVLLLAALALFPASELATGLLNRLWVQNFRPRHLPRLELAHGLSADLKTLVVMPVMLRTPLEAVGLVRELEVHALANPDPHVRFALLSDWADSTTEASADDALILDAAVRAVAALNQLDRKPPNGEARFYLFHRRRQWNERERCFMGWERKRGKLMELNRLLLGPATTSFVPSAVPSGVRFVLTLDADTRLPLGAVRDLVGVAAHPLNQPVFDHVEQRVVRGYGVLQPRITPLLPTREERSRYREIVTGGSGLDPYAAAVSDVYQDLFGEGLFTGKGLYEVATFEAALAGRVPENALLSHDLFEGLFARCALVTDVELFEDFPSHSEVAAARAHRWIRGDWQLLPWILGLRGRLPPLGRWKMLDNLRRSLLAPASVALLLAGWSVPSARSAVWLGMVLLPWLLPALVSAIERLVSWPATQSAVNLVRQLATELSEDLARAAVAFGMLAQNTWLSLDAIVRALARLAITHRRRLEWATAAQLKARSNDALRNFVWPLKGASLIVLFATACILLLQPGALLSAAPILTVWWLSPLLARFLSRPMHALVATATLDVAGELEMRRIARETWRYFERFVTADEHFLPPDNFQERPTRVVAHRGSPTNFGLYLLSIVAARDFGWLGVNALATRLNATFDTLARLERFNGHFLNWYDTATLAPLEPRYVSTVDSGNFAGHLIALSQALNEIKHDPALARSAFTGPTQALTLCSDVLAHIKGSGTSTSIGVSELQTCLQQLRQSLSVEPSSLPAAAQRLLSAQIHAVQLEDLAQAFAVGGDARHASVAAWAQCVHADIDTHVRDLRVLLPLAPNDLPPDARNRWTAVEAQLPRSTTLRALVRHHTEQLIAVQKWSSPAWSAAEQLAHTVLVEEIKRAATTCVELLAQLRQLGSRSTKLAASMPFGFLFNRTRGLFSIGFRVAEHALDAGYYDLLASEARLASFVAIAKGDVPRSHWSKLGRRLTGGSKRPVLASWSGSMFEYLMPVLVMREPRDSILDQSSRHAIEHQIAFGAEHLLPWGISESAYNVRDRELTYQYSAFGLPSLGLKRGLGGDHVVAPYATALAAMYAPEEARRNFQALDAYASRGDYGYYEAIDFTTRRVPDPSTAVVIHAFMAHHQGMTLVALDNALNDHIMQRRFHAAPMIQAAELLLQERAVRFVDAPMMIEASMPDPDVHAEQPELERRVIGVAASNPVTHLLSNRHYSVMITDSGAGYSLSRSRAVTRWREDSTRDCWGSFIYLRDMTSGRYWSAGFQPTAVVPDHYEVLYKEERVAITRRDGSLTSTLEIVVAAEDDGELRRVSLHNAGVRAREIELTSYAEIVLAPQRADVAHPGFSNLFVRTEFAQDSECLLAMRRPRSHAEPPVWAAHALTTSSGGNLHLEHETDRHRFLGRGRGTSAPLVIDEGRPLSNTVGSVLDPIFSLRTRVSIPPGETVTVTFATLVADSRDQVLALVAKYRHPAIFDHVIGFAWTFVRAELHHLQSDLVEARQFQALAAHLLFANRQLRAAGDVIAANRLDVTHLWRFGISGDRPILLILCRSNEEQNFLRQCLRAQEYLRIKRLFFDVVILNEMAHSYVHDLQDNIERTVRACAATAPLIAGEERGSVHALRTDQLSPAEHALLLAVARVVLQPEQGSLAEQMHRPDSGKPAELWPMRTAADNNETMTAAAAAGLSSPREFFNGLGGFSADGREYVITLESGNTTPAPWSNVIANENFGTLVTESGAMCTWSLNSRENQLSPWSNDATADPSGEAFFICDADSRALWSPTPQPIRMREASYSVQHGQGYSRFGLQARGIASDLQVFVPGDDPLKLCRLRLTNRSARPRRLTIVAYVEWSLGPSRAGSAANVVTEIDAQTGAMFARSPLQAEFGTRVAFCDLGGRQQNWTASRREFLGRNGQLSSPAGMQDVTTWSRRVGAGFDPCCAFAATVTLAPGASDEIVFALGQAHDAKQARELVIRYRRTDPGEALQEVRRRWDKLLDTVQIRTPDRALDLLFNRWLLYQTVSCRLWARAGFYQAGGAYGFRDQLQDGMALTLAAPALTRAHLLRAAARQFREGDVQHWWHPPSGRGVRTHFSDDRVWLPYAVLQYLEVTRDASVLEEPVPFIEGLALSADQEDIQFEPSASAETASLYTHCARALDASLRVGLHGLPLIGGGDWNDGMNRVGHNGRGESVWLAWFLISNLRSFAKLAEGRGEIERALHWREHAQALALACEQHGWDGAWYRRAFFDDGSALGSAANLECRIDSIAQSWAVLSGAADPERAARAMDSVEQYLVRTGDGLVLLFTPPFDVSTTDPGYVKGYLPGLRENGGQYTHAAIWVLMAQAALGKRAQVGALLDMLNPVRRAESRSGAQAYRVEPYVIAADVYSAEPHARRGGWTWYTGASGWFYRAILESVLGVQIRGETMTIKPCMPPNWAGFEVDLNQNGLDYLIQVHRVEHPQDAGTELDGSPCIDGLVPLLKDGRRHIVRVAVS
jgi:cyclic beta-1,2-glucan synthetase